MKRFGGIAVGDTLYKPLKHAFRYQRNPDIFKGNYVAKSVESSIYLFSNEI